jgi:hypothetical protein
MNLTTTTHPFEAIASSLRAADALLLPAEPSAIGLGASASGSTTAGDDVLHELCTSPAARAAIIRAATIWQGGQESACEPLNGLLVIPIALPRNRAGGRFAVVTILAEALECETIEFLAQSASTDARLAKSRLAATAPWTRRSADRLK